jgi:hypothetical protein
MPRSSYRRSASLCLSTFVAVVVGAALSSAPNAVDAWSSSLSSSSFSGKTLATKSLLSPAWSSSSSAVLVAPLPKNGSTMTMKKGKPNIPVHMRGQYRREQEMAEMQRDMMAASRASDDGLPVFNLFVRTKRQKVRVPVRAVAQRVQ